MTAQEARQISNKHQTINATIVLIDKLIFSEAEFGKRGTKVDIGRDIIHVIRDHYKTNGFNVDVQSNNGIYTLFLGW
jgi:hypothetical protein